jgi:hypothetical protein
MCSCALRVQYFCADWNLDLHDLKKRSKYTEYSNNGQITNSNAATVKGLKNKASSICVLKLLLHHLAFQFHVGVTNRCRYPTLLKAKQSLRMFNPLKSFP